MEIDYVVIGAGSAGCVLANRLSEDPDVTVLLLEAGGSERDLGVMVPAAFSELFGTDRDWGYQTDPEPNVDDRRLYWPRGRMLGGSSSMNAMIYIRGNPADYDGWADAGCEGWSFDEVLPYFRRSEDNSRGSDAYHGEGGPLPVTDLVTPNPMSEAFVESAVRAGLQRNPDFNAGAQDGVGFYQVNQRGGIRASAARGYLRPVMDRENLVVRTGVHVTRVVVESGRAIGVEALVDGRLRAVRAHREVLLSAGSVNSPQLLELSGIGQPDRLRDLGIEPVVESPEVGENLQDHPAVPCIWFAHGSDSIDDADGLRHLAEWILRRTGKLTSNVGEAGGFLRVDDAAEAPDVQLHFAPAFFHDHGRVDAPQPAFTIGPTLLQPESRGSVHAERADPTVAPRIRANYLESRVDLDRLVEGCRVASQIAGTKPLASYTDRPFLLDDSSREGLSAHVRRALQTLYHPVGTCRMGADDGAVVDPDLRVRGVQGLRVVDASIMPTIPRGNTNAPTIMVAERAADLIRRRI